MCNVKIAEGLTKGALDTVARNYYLQCLVSEYGSE